MLQLLSITLNLIVMILNLAYIYVSSLRITMLTTLKYLFIPELINQEVVTQHDLPEEGLKLKLVSGIWYLGNFLGCREESEVWVRHQVEACDHRVRTLNKIAKQDF